MSSIELDIDGPVAAVEIFLDAIPGKKAPILVTAEMVQAADHIYGCNARSAFEAGLYLFVHDIPDGRASHYY